MCCHCGSPQGPIGLPSLTSLRANCPDLQGRRQRHCASPRGAHLFVYVTHLVYAFSKGALPQRSMISPLWGRAIQRKRRPERRQRYRSTTRCGAQRTIAIKVTREGKRDLSKHVVRYNSPSPLVRLRLPPLTFYTSVVKLPHNGDHFSFKIQDTFYCHCMVKYNKILVHCLKRSSIYTFNIDEFHSLDTSNTIDCQRMP